MLYKIKKMDTSGLSAAQLETIGYLAHDLSAVKDKVTLIDDLVVRAGFVLDTLLNVPPNDIDVLYSTKEQKSGLFGNCVCDKIREQIKDLDLKLFDKKHELDLGHSGEGEVYVPIVEKAVGYHSHLIDVADMVCVDTNGDVWGNERSEYCLKNRIHEIRYDGWILFSYFIKEFPFTDYYYFVTANILRGLKMIHTKSYQGVGENFLTLLENSEPILEYTKTVDKYRESLKKYHAKKCPFMGESEIRRALSVTKAGNQSYIFDTLLFMFS